MCKVMNARRVGKQPAADRVYVGRPSKWGNPFVIGRDGSVSNVGNGGSDLPDSGVVSCVLSAFYGLSFPQPEGGIVTVVYPIMLEPG